MPGNILTDNRLSGLRYAPPAHPALRGLFDVPAEERPYGPEPRSPAEAQAESMAKAEDRREALDLAAMARTLTLGAGAPARPVLPRSISRPISDKMRTLVGRAQDRYVTDIERQHGQEALLDIPEYQQYAVERAERTTGLLTAAKDRPGDVAAAAGLRIPKEVNKAFSWAWADLASEAVEKGVDVDEYVKPRILDLWNTAAEHGMEQAYIRNTARNLPANARAFLVEHRILSVPGEPRRFASMPTAEGRYRQIARTLSDADRRVFHNIVGAMRASTERDEPVPFWEVYEPYRGRPGKWMHPPIVGYPSPGRRLPGKLTLGEKASDAMFGGAQGLASELPMIPLELAQMAGAAVATGYRGASRVALKGLRAGGMLTPDQYESASAFIEHVTNARDLLKSDLILKAMNGWRAMYVSEAEKERGWSEQRFLKSMQDPAYAGKTLGGAAAAMLAYVGLAKAAAGLGAVGQAFVLGAPESASVRRELIEAGVSEEVAAGIVAVLAPVIGYIETAQVGQLLSRARDPVLKSLRAAVKSGGLKEFGVQSARVLRDQLMFVGRETIEELAQGLSADAARAIGGVPVRAEEFWDERLGEAIITPIIMTMLGVAGGAGQIGARTVSGEEAAQVRANVRRAVSGGVFRGERGAMMLPFGPDEPAPQRPEDLDRLQSERASQYDAKRGRIIAKGEGRVVEETPVSRKVAALEREYERLSAGRDAAEQKRDEIILKGQPTEAGGRARYWTGAGRTDALLAVIRSQRIRKGETYAKEINEAIREKDLPAWWFTSRKTASAPDQILSEQGFEDVTDPVGFLKNLYAQASRPHRVPDTDEYIQADAEYQQAQAAAAAAYHDLEAARAEAAIAPDIATAVSESQDARADAQFLDAVPQAAVPDALAGAIAEGVEAEEQFRRIATAAGLSEEEISGQLRWQPAALPPVTQATAGMLYERGAAEAGREQVRPEGPEAALTRGEAEALPAEAQEAAGEEAEGREVSEFERWKTAARQTRRELMQTYKALLTETGISVAMARRLYPPHLKTIAHATAKDLRTIIGNLRDVQAGRAPFSRYAKPAADPHLREIQQAGDMLVGQVVFEGGYETGHLWAGIATDSQAGPGGQVGASLYRELVRRRGWQSSGTYLGAHMHKLINAELARLGTSGDEAVLLVKALDNPAYLERLPERMLPLYQAVRELFDTLWAEMVPLGLGGEFSSNYIAHLYRDTPERTFRYMTAGTNSFLSRQPFQMTREFQTLDAAEDAGKTPLYDAGALVEVYIRAASNALANAKFKNAIGRMRVRARDPEGTPASVPMIASGPHAPEGYTDMSGRPFVYDAVTTPGFETRARRPTGPQGAEIEWLTKPTYAIREAAALLNDVGSKDVGDIIKAFRSLWGAMKRLKLAFATWHIPNLYSVLAAELNTGLVGAVQQSQEARRRESAGDLAYVMAPLRAGLVFALDSDTARALTEGFRTNEARLPAHLGPAMKAVMWPFRQARILTDKLLWQGIHKPISIAAFWGAYDRFKAVVDAEYPDRFPDWEIQRAAAQYVNMQTGALPDEMYSRELRAIFRAVFLGPNWTPSNLITAAHLATGRAPGLRGLGRAGRRVGAKGGRGTLRTMLRAGEFEPELLGLTDQQQRRHWLRALAHLVPMQMLLWRLFSDDERWYPTADRLFQFPTPFHDKNGNQLYFGIPFWRYVYDGIMWALDPGRTLKGKLHPGAAAIVEVFTGKRLMTKRVISPPGATWGDWLTAWAGHLGSKFVPIPVQKAARPEAQWWWFLPEVFAVGVTADTYGGTEAKEFHDAMLDTKQGRDAEQEKVRDRAWAAFRAGDPELARKIMLDAKLWQPRYASAMVGAWIAPNIARWGRLTLAERKLVIDKKGAEWVRTQLRADADRLREFSSRRVQPDIDTFWTDRSKDGVFQEWILFGSDAARRYAASRGVPSKSTEALIARWKAEGAITFAPEPTTGGQ